MPCPASATCLMSQKSEEFHAFRRHQGLCGDRRSQGRGQCRDHAGAAFAGQGRARHRQDRAGAGDRQVDRRAADRVARQVDHQGAAGPLRIRRGVAPARQPARRRPRAGHPQLHQARQIVGRLRRRRAPGAADRRDRQGRHRVPQRPAAGTRSHGVLRLRDRRDREGAPPAGRHHHLEQREGTAGRLPAPLLLPLHPVSRSRHHDGDHRRAFPRHQAAAGQRGAANCSTRSATCRA